MLSKKPIEFDSTQSQVILCRYNSVHSSTNSQQGNIKGCSSKSVHKHCSDSSSNRNRNFSLWTNPLLGIGWKKAGELSKGEGKGEGRGRACQKTIEAAILPPCL